MTNDKIIEARGLGKRFTVKKQTVDAVADLDLDVHRGELVAFLGPNGAGKSTSLRMLTTLLPPTTGTAVVAGSDIRTDPAGVRSRIGYVGQGNSAGHNQRVRDELLSQGAFYGMAKADARRRADELLDSLELAPLADRGVMSMSGGQRRRLDIALGLIHAPELLFLDEPSTGLDPQSRANLWQHLLELRREHGTTLFVTTHYLDEADRFAERVLVMDHGRVIADDSAPALKTTLASDVIVLGFDGEVPVIPVTEHVELAGRQAIIRVKNGDQLLPRLLHDLDAAGTPVSRVTLTQPTLDDVFLALTGRSLRDGEQTTEAETQPTTDEKVPA